MVAAERRWGIVGTSRIAREFVAALKRTPGAILHGVISRDPAAANRFAKEHGFAVAYPTLKALLADPFIDIVYVAVPTRLHHAVALAVLEAGKPLLLEKPFTATAAQAEEVVASARMRSLFCMEAMWLRYNSAIQKCRDDLAAGRLGQMSMMTMEIGYAKAPDQLGQPPDGRGAGSVFGCYGLSLALHLFGPPQGVRAHAVLNAAGVDTEAGYLLSYPRYLVSIVASVGATLSNEVWFYGDKARILVPSPFLDATERVLTEDEASPWQYRARALYAPIKKRLPSTRALRGSGLRGEAAEAMRCLDHGLTESPSMPLDETLAVHRLMTVAHIERTASPRCV
jgi:predicted dehydrogenase